VGRRGGKCVRRGMTRGEKSEKMNGDGGSDSN